MEEKVLDKNKKLLYINGIYEHYKGNKYKVLDVCKHTETNELMIYYVDVTDENKRFVRPLLMFLGTVTLKVDRFNLINRNDENLQAIETNIKEN